MDGFLQTKNITIKNQRKLPAVCGLWTLFSVSLHLCLHRLQHVALCKQVLLVYDHWNKYPSYGIILCPHHLVTCLCLCKPKVFYYRMLAYRREKLGRLGVLRPKTDLASSISISKLPEDWACFLPLRQFLGCLFHTWSSHTQFVIIFRLF